MPFGTTDAVKKFLDAAPTVQVIHLNSQGGRMSEAYQLYKAIKERNLITYTSADCVSACTIAFLAGRERYLGENGRLGFHSVSLGELGGESVAAFNEDVRQTLRAHGTPTSFIDRALSTPPDDMWYPAHEDLLHAKIIDSVVDPRYFGLSGIAQRREANKVQSALLTNPLYYALARYDQDVYAKIRNIIVAGVQKGEAQLDIESKIRSILVGDWIVMHLKNAPDGPLVRYWRSQVAEMKHLATLSPQHCADFAFPEFAKSGQDLRRLLSEELQLEDIDALAAVVEGVATDPQQHEIGPGVESDLELVVANVMQKYPQALDVIQNPSGYKDDPASLCGAAIALYSEVLAIPSSIRSGAVLRYLLSE